MYSEKVLSHLNELKYLSAIKNSNVSIVSKKNAFADTVKFFAQINKNNVIQKISYKATGCTHFLVYCDYFCSLVEGLTITKALKININDLENLSKLNESKVHVVDIILNTFALLIKKYQKGVQKGEIIPADIIEKEDSGISTKIISESKKLSEITKEIKAKNKTVASLNEIDSAEKITKDNVKQTKVSPNHNANQTSNIMALKSMIDSSKSNNSHDTQETLINTDDSIYKLSTMIDNIGKQDDNTTNNIHDDENTQKLKSLTNSLDNIKHKQENEKTKKKDDSKQNKVKKSKFELQDEKLAKRKEEKLNNTEEKKKKGLFSWFKSN